MTTSTSPAAGRRPAASQAPAAVVDALVGAGLLLPEQHDPAYDVVAGVLAHAESGTGSAVADRPPLRRRMAEVAGYVGAAFVVGAATLFFTQTWDSLTLVGQVAILLGIGVVLGGSTIALVATAGGRDAVRRPGEAVRRRLASVLATAAGGATALGVGLLLTDVLSNDDLGVMLAALTGLLLVLAGYALAPTVVGQLGAAFAAFVTVPSGLAALESDSSSMLPVGLLALALGLAWWVLAERGVWHEPLAGRVIGGVLLVIGGQLPLGDEQAWVAYLLTTGVGLVAFGVYTVTRSWPHLATGVVALTLAVPEALSDWTDGSLGAAGVLLATGVTLLVASLLGLRIHRTA
jgi:hypothetical protein